MATLKQIFNLAIQAGRDNDPRGEQEVQLYLEQNKKYFDSLCDEEKQYYNTEFLTNPYHDSLVYHGDDSVEVKKLII